jgi:hypothetical protein
MEKEGRGLGSINRILAIVVTALGVVAIVIGGVFVYEGVAKNNLIVNRMKVEQVTLALDPNNPNQLTTILTAGEAQKAADTIAEHRRSIAPSYQALLNEGTGKFDPSNTTDVTYAQAMNLENYLYTAVLAFGVVQIVLAAGAFMIVAGIAFEVVALVLFKLSRKAAA